MAVDPHSYIGRFAPSPTGPLHFGSLVAGLASFLDARSHNGRWLVRMEDLDTDRERPGAADQILRDLEHFGLHWDGTVMYQTRRTDAYQAAFEKLDAAGLLYACGCSRKESAGRYAGTCAAGLAPSRTPRAWRIRVPVGRTFSFVDLIHGPYAQDVQAAIGDFIIRRADGPFAYQLAVVVDDAAQGVTNIVRGADLLDNTPRQIYLQQSLGFPQPSYAHVPVAADPHGLKLSKSTGAAALRRDAVAEEITRALRFLGHAPPGEMAEADSNALLAWAVSNWSVSRVPSREIILLSH